MKPLVCASGESTINLMISSIWSRSRALPSRMVLRTSYSRSVSHSSLLARLGSSGSFGSSGTGSGLGTGIRSPFSSRMSLPSASFWYSTSASPSPSPSSLPSSSSSLFSSSGGYSSSSGSSFSSLSLILLKRSSSQMSGLILTRSSFSAIAIA